MKAKKRILAVKIKRMFDDSPDTSYLGEYSNTAKTEFAIDRMHSEDCASLTEVQTFDCPACGQSFPDAKLQDVCRNCGEAVLEDGGLVEQECNCGGHQVSSREYRYFNFASGCPFEKSGMASKDEWHADMQKYARQDYERMESYNNQNWYYLGIRAEAEIMLHVKQENQESITGPMQTITSGGLWGIESDSDKDYIKSVEQEELSNLKAQLLAIGFSRRAIATAFKNVEEVSE